MSETARMEFDVEVFGSGCSTKIEQSLKAVPGVAEVHIDGGSSPKVIVDAAVPSEQIKSVIESTGRRAVLMGYGTSKGTNLGAAVAMLSSSSSSIQGITRFVQVSESVCVVDATIDGLASNERHGLFVHEYGDLSGGCESTGPVLEFPQGHPSLSPGTMQNGCLGDATADSNGRLSFRADVERVKVGDIIGRSLVVHGPREKGGGLWERLACGVIARSSGLFQNSKKICSCDGVTLWDERDVPEAGKGRQKSYETIPEQPQSSL